MFATEAVPRISILGVNVTPMTMQRAASLVDEAVRYRQKMRVLFCNTHMIVGSQDDSALMEAVNAAEIVATDGMPLVWISRLKGAQGIERVYGPDAMLAFCEHGLSRGWRHYFYGGTAESIELLTARLQVRFPGIQVAGSFSPPFRKLTEPEKQSVIGQINVAKPDLVWVGLGMPKQELWSAEFRPHLESPVLLAVGAAFDFHAGTVKQAPQWMQRASMEWLYRLTQEPQRLWRRYLIGNTRFLWLFGRELLLGPRSASMNREKANG